MTGIVEGAALGWFANKIFGPSFDALGKNLSAHLQSRAPRIFGRAEQIANDKGIEPGPIKPGLLSRMIVDASFSEDEPTITDWWAHLFVSASQCSDNRHAVFSDMMATIGPLEAAALNKFYEFVLSQAREVDLPLIIDPNMVVPVIQRNVLSKFLERLPLEDDARDQVDRIIGQSRTAAAARPFAWCLPSKSEDRSKNWPLTSEIWFKNHSLEFEVLERSRIVAFERIDVPVLANQTAFIDYLRLTSIGLEFCKACTGLSPKEVVG